MENTCVSRGLCPAPRAGVLHRRRVTFSALEKCVPQRAPRLLFSRGRDNETC